ncbi:MAG: outer membrane beta-barrel protein [Proteobacteria bacterium]|nr:outer membrane beta-barrel protein [Pseudomonadota bacterium]
MSSHKGVLVSALILAAITPQSSYSAFWAPHIGVDYKWWGLEPNETYLPIFPRIDHAFNFYVGTRINGYFGIDFGYEESSRRQLSTTFEGGEIFFVEPELPYDATNITMRLKDFHMDLNFYWEVWRNFEIIFFAGLAMLHIDTHIYHLTSGTWFEFQNESEKKAMGRIGLGFQYNILPCVGFKFFINGDPCIRINDMGFDQYDNFYSFSPYKTAISYNLGIVYSFSNPRRHRTIVVEDPYRDND